MRTLSSRSWVLYISPMLRTAVLALLLAAAGCGEAQPCEKLQARLVECGAEKSVRIDCPEGLHCGDWCACTLERDLAVSSECARDTGRIQAAGWECWREMCAATSSASGGGCP